MLKLVRDNGEESQTCPECKGKGWVPAPPVWGVRGNNPNPNQYGPQLQPCYRKPIPCPMCKGKKVV